MIFKQEHAPGLENKEQACSEFLDYVRKQPSLRHLADSQAFKAINIFQNLALEYALKRAERAHQDSYLSTALKRSSILALSEDRQYVPRKAAPSQGKARVANKTDRPLGVPALTALVSEDQRPYLSGDAITVPARGEATIDVRQLRQESVQFDVSEEKAFLELELDRALSRSVASLSVFVDEGQGFTQWQKSIRFRNCHSRSMVFDEFYSHTDQLGVRFGNGIFGRIPPKGSRVRVDVLHTDGETQLLPGQRLHPTRPDRLSGLEFYSSTVINGGASAEKTESIRKNALYYALYDDEAVWGDDYKYFILRKHPTINWLNVWGEQEQEEMEGKLDAANINKIFFCAHAPGEPDIEEKVATSLQELPMLNRRFSAVERQDIHFTVTISGCLKRSVFVEDARSMIRQVLQTSYGQDSTERLDSVRVRDLYAALERLGIFSPQHDLQITVSGGEVEHPLRQMAAVDLTASMNALDIGYDEGRTLRS